jgi:probable HAF family extracellular repeat protein
MEDMGTLGGNFGGATRIDDSGEVAGWATDAEEKILAVLWKNGKMTNLGSIDGCSVAWDAKHGRAVGASFVCGGPYLHAFLWEHGSIVDLNTLVPPGSGVQLTLANYINESGEITAAGLLSNGDNHSFLLIPCDEHHPGIEGCDYSMAAGEVASVRPAQQERKLPPGSALWQRGYRFHLPRSLVGQRN